MPFLDVVKNILNLEPPKPALKLVVVNSFANHSELPTGFFRVRTVSGRETLGYNGSFLAWEVGETVVDGAKRVTLSIPRAELPLVELDYRSQGSNVVKGHSIVETDTDGGDVNWTGAPPSSGVQLR
jgi:hypothetical protein